MKKLSQVVWYFFITAFLILGSIYNLYINYKYKSSYQMTPGIITEKIDSNLLLYNTKVKLISETEQRSFIDDSQYYIFDFETHIGERVDVYFPEDRIDQAKVITSRTWITSYIILLLGIANGVFIYYQLKNESRK